MMLKGAVLVLGVWCAALLYLMVVELNPFIKHCNADVCREYALSAFQVRNAVGQGASNCDYGVLPGYLSFNVMNPAGARWKTAASMCQLQNLLLDDAPTGPVKVMLFGDSVDAHLAQHWCALLQQPLMFTPTGLKGNVAAFAAAVKAQASGSSSKNKSDPGSAADTGDGCCKDRDMFYYCKPKDPQAADRISIGMFHLPGVHLEGPYHTGVKGNFLTRIPTALKSYNDTFGGPPDLVIMHSNFWDQSRMWEQQETGYGQLNKLMPDTVFSYSSNFSLLLSTTKEYLPQDFLIATRTAAFPAFSANWLGRWSYIHQLNSAATEVTRLHGMSVIDLGGMVFGLEPKQYLDDQHHPNKLVLLECANIALNLLMQQRQRLAAERTGSRTHSPEADAAVTATVEAAAVKAAADAGSIRQSSSSSAAQQGADVPASSTTKRKEQPLAADGEG